MNKVNIDRPTNHGKIFYIHKIYKYNLYYYAHPISARLIVPCQDNIIKCLNSCQVQRLLAGHKIDCQVHCDITGW